MLLADLVGYVGNGLKKITVLNGQEKAEWDTVLKGIDDHSQRLKRRQEHYEAISGKYRLQIEAIREDITMTVRNHFCFPPGITVEKIEGREDWGSKEQHLSQLKLTFMVDPNLAKRLEFSSLYADLYKRKEQVLGLKYSAKLGYDTGAFLEDSYFDPRAFRSLSMSKKGHNFSPSRFLERKDIEGTLRIEYDPSYHENRFEPPHGVIHIRPGYGNGVWHPILKEVAKKFKGVYQVHIYGEDYASLVKEKSFFDRIKANIQVRAILEKRTTSRAVRKITRAIVAYAAGAIFDRNHSWDSYEGTITVDQLEMLELALGTSVTPFVNSVTIPAEIREDYRKVRETLRELAAYLDQIQVPGTSPGQFRITEEQARQFLDEDLKTVHSMANDVPLSSGFVRRGMGRVLEGSEHDRMHLPLLRKLRELTTLDLESCIGGHHYDYVYSRSRGMKDQSEVNPDKYYLKPLDVLLKEFQRVGLPQQSQQNTFQILETRKEEYWKNGFLTIHELYDLHLSVLLDMQRGQPDVLLQRYRELYRDVPATSLSILGSIDGHRSLNDKDKPSEFPQPFVMNPSGSLQRFEVSDGDDSLDDNKVVLYDNKLHITIVPSNPCLLPLQQHVLETIGIQCQSSPAPRR